MTGAAKVLHFVPLLTPGSDSMVEKSGKAGQFFINIDAADPATHGRKLGTRQCQSQKFRCDSG